MGYKKLASTFAIYWLLPLCYMGVIFCLSSLPSKRISAAMPDYFLHMGEYFFLSILMIRGFNKGFRRNVEKESYFMGVIISSIYAISDEIHQMFVPTRQADIRDIAADILGALAAAGLIYIVLYWKRSRLSAKEWRS